MKGLSSNLPSSVSVRFSSRRCNGSPSSTIPAFYEKTIPIVDGAAIDGLTGHPGTKIFLDRALALYDGGGTTPTNKAALDTLASQIALDFYDWGKESFDESYPGIISPILDGLTDTIEWEYRRDRCITRRYSSVVNDYPEDLMHYDPSAKTGCSGNDALKTPCFESYGPVASGSTNLSVQVFKNCFHEGTLTQEYVRTESIGCGCQFIGTCRPLIARILDGCNSGIRLLGATVELWQGSTLVSTEITKSQLLNLNLLNGGSGFTNGTNYNATFSGGGGTTQATAIFDVVAGKVTNVRLTSGGEGYTSAPTISYAAAGAGTGTSTQIFIDTIAGFYGVPDGTNYKFVASYTDKIKEESALFGVPAATGTACPVRELSLIPIYGGPIHGTGVIGCSASSGGTSNATATATQGSTTETVSINSDGTYQFLSQWKNNRSPYQVVPPVSIEINDGNGRWLSPKSLGTTTPFACGTTRTISGNWSGNTCLDGSNIPHDVLGSRTCWYTDGSNPGASPCFLPISQTLILTDPLAGDVTLTWGCNPTSGGPVWSWKGSAVVTFPGCVLGAGLCGGGCGGAKSNTCPEIQVTLNFELSEGISVGSNDLVIYWNTFQYRNCNIYDPSCFYLCTGDGDELNPFWARTSIQPTFVSATCPPAFTMEFTNTLVLGECDLYGPGTGQTWSIVEE